MRVSDWVHTCHNMNKITGYITNIFHDRIDICVTIPRGYGNISVNRRDAWLADDTIWMDDIPAMIDLSLMIRDKEWFDHWMKEMSLWKSVQIADSLF
ncbi:hypothetical protein [Brevibacillus borstelensis]|uniref:hypothetical protein n=1 Tax=Brevibacillus TaxID=55080 RepID=UPI0004F281EA|nr:hypothetical protein [Brevibacillus borstelensis]KKX52427.1 hypothetical protein X546_25265 [Brevibacillus borstelensis cifa_chp40]